jgi:membrane-associated phospholipid phosphatase
MRFLTDFADQAVVLPLIVVVALVLAGLGWRRGAVAWLAAVGVTFGAVLTLKLVLFTCGPALHLATLRSPSGHTAAAAIIAGGIAVTLRRRKREVGAIALLSALVIGVTRVALGWHSTPEVVVGGTLGVLGALGFAWLAGSPPTLRLRWVFVSIVAVALLLHGQHLNAESRIRAVAFNLPFCADDPMRP